MTRNIDIVGIRGGVQCHRCGAIFASRRTATTHFNRLHAVACRRCGTELRSPRTFYCDCTECYMHTEHLKQCGECGDTQHYPGPRPLPLVNDL